MNQEDIAFLNKYSNDGDWLKYFSSKFCFTSLFPWDPTDLFSFRIRIFCMTIDAYNKGNMQVVLKADRIMGLYYLAALKYCCIPKEEVTMFLFPKRPENDDILKKVKFMLIYKKV